MDNSPQVLIWGARLLPATALSSPGALETSAQARRWGRGYISPCESEIAFTPFPWAGGLGDVIPLRILWWGWENVGAPGHLVSLSQWWTDLLKPQSSSVKQRQNPSSRVFVRIRANVCDETSWVLDTSHGGDYSLISEGLAHFRESKGSPVSSLPYYKCFVHACSSAEGFIMIIMQPAFCMIIIM